ncbi:hypothetical protein MAR_44 [Vibrio phage vB_VpaM_MAR]|uniref:Uncharacterized protein n=1 Tax=Vibrio phage vB_VpaM_MAR TaxID=1229754 RepID=K7RFZ3_9CAUD|nr:hypothetical protein F861_gp43 [Vibrio phage vB_VpaM_MAR]AFV81382.1 hypothetical protein MAR_44 [Vibrio phage vB_VpaM_MAR]
MIHINFCILLTSHLQNEYKIMSLLFMLSPFTNYLFIMFLIR